MTYYLLFKPNKAFEENFQKMHDWNKVCDNIAEYDYVDYMLPEKRLSPT